VPPAPVAPAPVCTGSVAVAQYAELRLMAAEMSPALPEQALLTQLLRKLSATGTRSGRQRHASYQ